MVGKLLSPRSIIDDTYRSGARWLNFGNLQVENPEAGAEGRIWVIYIARDLGPLARPWASEHLHFGGDGTRPQGHQKSTQQLLPKKKVAKHYVFSPVWARDLALGLGPLARPWAS